MKGRKPTVLILGLALLGVAALAWVTGAHPGRATAPLAPGGSPTVVAYQGEVRLGGTPYTGDGFFKFAVVNAAGDTTYWSNDGTASGEPTAAVQLAVSEGLFSVLLGDTTLGGGMTEALTAEVFNEPDRYLRVWFSSSGGGPFDPLTPDTRVAAVPYALQAQEAADAHTVDGLHASQLATHYQNVVVVAKSGGDYTSVQAAIYGITDAAADNPYLVWVAPGVYQEQVTMYPYIHLQGAGNRATIISSTVSSTGVPRQGTLALASDTTLRDLTVTNLGAGDDNTALLVPAGTVRALVANVIARAQGVGKCNYGIRLNGMATLNGVGATAQNASDFNAGLLNEEGALVTVLGGWFTGRGGDSAYGIYNADGGTTMEADGATALAQNGGSLNYGLLNGGGATATLWGGWFAGLGGPKAIGIYNDGSGTTLTAENVTALGEDGAIANYGLYSWDGAAATLQGGWFTASGGGLTGGIYNGSTGETATLEAEGVTALGENSTAGNYGLMNYLDATATLRGGSFTGRGGTRADGIYNDASGATLTAEGVTALGEEGTGENHGLYNHFYATARLVGGSFTARGGTDAYGIYNDASGAMLTAESVTALGEEGSDENHGLYNHSYATATLRGGSFTGRGGTDAYGIYNNASGATLEAGSVTALAENGSSINHGLHNSGAATATLRGGSFTGSGEVGTDGIYNTGSNTTLEASNVTALAEGTSGGKFGLGNFSGASATLRGGSFTGRGGTNARGIHNYDATLEAEGVSALGEGGSESNIGLNVLSGTANVTQSVLAGTTRSVYLYDLWGGSATVSNSRLISVLEGSVTCVAVSRGNTFLANGCP